MKKINNTNTVQVHYTGKLTNGQIFDSSIEREPLKVTLGQGQLIPGFENALIDMEVNQEKTIEIPCNEAYGEKKQELFHEVNKAQLPAEIKPEVGLPLMSQTPDGQTMHFTISEVKDETVVVDGNHPLAGQDLIFDLKIVAIED